MSAKKVVICNVPMKKELFKCNYETDSLTQGSDRAVIYPINAYLEKNLKQGDKIKVILLIKKDNQENYKKNVDSFKEELKEATKDLNLEVEYENIETDFAEEQSVHHQLMGMLIDKIDDESSIVMDMTYGPKDLPVVSFAALKFAEKFLDCEVESIIYGQAKFVDGVPTDTKLCNMMPLYSLDNITSAAECDNATRARALLKKLLSI